MTFRRLAIGAAFTLFAFAAKAQNNLTAAFLVGEEQGGQVVISDVVAIVPEISNDAVMAHFGKLPAAVPANRWRVVRFEDEASARRSRTELEAKYRSSGRKVKELK